MNTINRGNEYPRSCQYNPNPDPCSVDYKGNNLYPAAYDYRDRPRGGDNNCRPCCPDIELTHGRVVTPPSRSQVLVNQGLLAVWEANETYGGKNFPNLTGGGVPFPFHQDEPSRTPPPDYFILSGGHRDRRDRVNFTDTEMSQTLGRAFQWPRLPVQAGSRIGLRWIYNAGHATRGYRWFITRDGWNPQYRIARDDLDPLPFYDDLNPQTPFWSHPAALQPRVDINVQIPSNKRGHHVLVLLWITADTGYAFYQAFDVNIS